MRLEFTCVLLGAWLAVAGGNAIAAPCDRADETSSASSRREWTVASALFQADSRLLGLDGSRVPALGALTPVPRLVDGRMQLPPSWIERVDWSVYGLGNEPAANPDPRTTTLQFESNADGSRTLCRIEKRAASFASVASQRMVYDDGGRLVEVETRVRDDAARPWRRTQAVCFRYARDGSLAAVAHVETAACASVADADADELYVHGTNGRLQRAITAAYRPEVGSESSRMVAHPVVRVYDAQGTLKAQYLDARDGRRYRLPDVAATRVEGFGGIWVLGSPAALSAGDPRQTLSTARPWKIVTLPDASNDPLRDAMEDGVPVAASGVASQDGRVTMDASAADKVWRAMHLSGKVVVLASGTNLYLLTPEVSPAVTSACLDPRSDATACP